MRGEIFQFTKGLKKKRSTFDLSHESKLSCNMGKLVPILTQEVLPGDSFKVDAQIMVRFAPLLAPIMHRVDVYTHFFFVPNRLVWNKWEEFITGGVDGTLAPSLPFYSVNQLKGQDKSICDYLGLPDLSAVDGNIKISSLPFRAYQLIYNNYYIDQNLSTPVTIDIDAEGQESNVNLVQLQNRCWEKDYFTSALPFSQRGPQVGVSLAGSAPVTGDFGLTNVKTSISGSHTAVDGPVDSYVYGANDSRLNVDGNDIDLRGTITGTPHADLSGVSAITINELRRLSKLQEWLEKNARGGARYVEQLLSHWGVISPDARLQRPEYLGGGKSPVQISEVLQTSQSIEDGTSQSDIVGVGNPYGKAISVGQFHGFKRSFSEHGYIIGIMSIMPRTAYSQGLHKHWQRFDKLDYAWPEFAHLGEQEVKNSELYLQHSNPDGTFGYQSRYAEYKYSTDEVHGDFRNTMSFWHLGRIFPLDPALNETFVKCNPSNRIFAVTDVDTDHLWVDLWLDIKASRNLPKFGTPYLG